MIIETKSKYRRCNLLHWMCSLRIDFNCFFFREPYNTIHDLLNKVRNNKQGRGLLDSVRKPNFMQLCLSYNNFSVCGGGEAAVLLYTTVLSYLVLN